MKYDFETLINRKPVWSSKWNSLKKSDGSPVDEGVIGFGLADMDFKNAPEIGEAIKEMIDTTPFGYTMTPPSYYDAVLGWQTRRHGWTPEKDWLVMIPGVVPALFIGLQTIEPNSNVIITPPVYHPFARAVNGTGHHLIESPLIHENGTYNIDFEDFETKIKENNVKAFIFCNPHNPVGRVWTKEEVEKLCKICCENGVLILSDEIHNDLILPGYQHTSVGTLSNEVLKNSIICTAPSKTFHMAGVKCSNIYIPDEDRRRKFTAVLSRNSISGINMFAYAACTAAYDKCEGWLDELLIKLDENKKLVESYCAAELPEVGVTKLEGTYLMWLNFSFLGMERDERKIFMTDKAQFFTNAGEMFGTGGENFERVNIACPTYALQAALERVSKAVKER